MCVGGWVRVCVCVGVGVCACVCGGGGWVNVQYASKKTSHKRAVQRCDRSRSKPVQIPCAFPVLSAPF